MFTKQEKQCDNYISNFKSSNQYLAVVICSFMATMYGQTVGWSSAAIPQLEKGGPFLPSGEEGIGSIYSGWIGGAFCLGALISAPVHGLLADAKGRKVAAYFIGFCFVIHWSLISFGGSMPLLIVARIFGGAGAAGSITISSIYSNEVAESRIRGTLGGFLALLYVVGIFCAFVVGAYASFYTTSYIYLATSILFLPAWWKMPETPAYLLLCNQKKKALTTIMWLRKCNESDADIVLSELKIQQAGAAKTASIREFFNHSASRRGILLASILSSIQTFSGIFAVHSYASTIFSRAGGILDPFTSTIIYGGSMCIGAVMPLILVDRSGRKALLAWSCSLLSISMVVLCLYFWGVSSGYLVSKYKSGPDSSTTDLIVSLLPIVTLSWSVFVYYIGLGSVTYISIAELFLDEMRGIAGAINAGVVWLTSFILLQFFGPSVELLGDHFVFLFFSIVCFSGTIFTITLLPETKNKSPQEIAERLTKK